MARITRDTAPVRAAPPAGHRQMAPAPTGSMPGLVGTVARAIGNEPFERGSTPVGASDETGRVRNGDAAQPATGPAVVPDRGRTGSGESGVARRVARRKQARERA